LRHLAPRTLGWNAQSVTAPGSRKLSVRSGIPDSLVRHWIRPETDDVMGVPRGESRTESDSVTSKSTTEKQERPVRHESETQKRMAAR